MFKKYGELWDQIKDKIEIINDGKKCKYDEDLTKIRFDTDDKTAHVDNNC